MSAAQDNCKCKENTSFDPERAIFYILNYKITEPLRALSLVDRGVYMRVCKNGCDVLDSRVFLRYIS